MRRQTITRHTALALLLVASFALPAVLAQTQERRPAPQEVPIEKGECPGPINNLTLTATTPNVFNADFPLALFNGQQFAWLNHPGINKPFLYTFELKRAERCCQISKALLIVKMKANQAGTPGGADAGNDGIAIMHNRNSVLPFSQAVYTPPVGVGQPSVKNWWLYGAALANLNMNRRLSIYVQDDTRVESATLQLWGCCLSPPRGGATEEAITADSQK
jgi:hypothetical protein